MEQERILHIITQSRQGDEKAFATLVREYQPLVFRLTFRLLCNEDDARDAVQETFIKVWLSLDKYDRRFRFSTWIYTIASNIVYDRLRKQQPILLDTTDINDLPLIADNDIEKSLNNQELRNLILYLTAKLTPSQRLVFTLRDLEGLDTDEVTTITGLSADKIKSNLYLARKYIREQLKSYKI
ncbi:MULTISPECIES: sigma-70 family RNA polymerase sigma factor [unclassified Parabacteroides]|uniref:RNA polymerase sigma factor n=1 Tax=unclassified Parabacteroides TaxID=2649774 RepID=UPI002476C4B1|nr:MULTISPECIES: sigma-70 family RNA polymerase sigma factor [unclassified Parabacteroides]